VKALAVITLFVLFGCNRHIDEQRLPIGNPCNSSGQCGTGKFFCDTTHPNGYCKAICGKDVDCPSGSVCVGAGILMNGACAKVCPNGVSDCRAGDICASVEASAAYCDQPPMPDAGLDGGLGD